MKYSGHKKLLCEFSKLSKFNAFNLLGSNTDASILVYKFRPERTGFNMYEEYARPQLTFIALLPWFYLLNQKTRVSQCSTLYRVTLRKWLYNLHISSRNHPWFIQIRIIALGASLNNQEYGLQMIFDKAQSCLKFLQHSDSI